MIVNFCDYVPHGPVSSWTNEQIAFHLSDLRRSRRDLGAFERELIAEAETRLPSAEHSLAILLTGAFSGCIVTGLISWLL